MRLLRTLLAGVVVVTAAPAATAEPAELAEGARALEAARRDGHDTFCQKPKRPLLPRQASLCPLAEDLPDCAAFLAQCREAEKPTDLGWLARIAEMLAPLLSVVVWLVVAVAGVAIALPIVLALRRANRDRRRVSTAKVREPSSASVVPEPETVIVGDAEAALREARARDAAGEHAAALALYLRASLHALDHRGALRLERSRTNGEYVRACTDSAMRPALAAIAREADRATFGAHPVTRDVVARVAEYATTIVRAAAGIVPTVVFAVAVLLGETGCAATATTPGSDPAGDELVVDVLRGAGYDVAYLETSLGALPAATEGSPLLLVVDTSRVPLDDEASAHLLAWVESGGAALLAGPAEGWPKALGAKSLPAHEAASFASFASPPERIEVALANGGTFAWEGGSAVAWSGDDVHAAARAQGQGSIMGIASSDLLTNVGVAHPARAAALLALVAHAADLSGYAGDEHRFRVRLARAEDGISPPGDPLAALVRAGLGPFVWHALAAVLVLFVAVGVRQSAPRRERLPSRRAFREHVVATGAFWHRARATGLAVSAYGRFVERRLRLRAPSGEDSVAHAAAASGMAADDIHALLDRARRGLERDPAPAEAADLIRRLARLVPPDAGRG